MLNKNTYILTEQEKDFIKSYTKNNIYMLNGLYNNSNIFNNYFLLYYKYFSYHQQ